MVLLSYLLVEKISCSAELSMKEVLSLQGAVGNQPDCTSSGRKFESQLSHITFAEFDHEVISMVILPLLLIQERQ